MSHVSLGLYLTGKVSLNLIGVNDEIRIIYKRTLSNRIFFFQPFLTIHGKGGHLYMNPQLIALRSLLIRLNNSYIDFHKYPNHWEVNRQGFVQCGNGQCE